MITIGSEDGVVLGRADGFVVKYSTSTAVKITSGSIEANGKSYTLAADTTHAMTSLAAGFDFHYIYLDDSESSASSPVFIDSTTQPAWSDSKRGWYNGDDRMIGVAASIAGASELLYFSSTALSGNHIRNTHYNCLTDLQLAAAQNPDGNWQAPNVAESDAYTPVNAIEAKITVQNNDSGSSVRVAWASNEVAAIFTSILQVAESIPSWNSIKLLGWAALGSSRKVKIGGNADDDNNLAAGVGGYGYSR